MTEKLYEKDSHMCSFEAQVIDCRPADGGYHVVLDRTAFFPESGGQFGDTGTIDGVRVADTQITSAEIIHVTEAPIEVGRRVSCALDWEQRFRRMQNHTGEHILCGHAHRLYGCSNVGFHLGSGEVTFDLDKELTQEQLENIEQLANLTVAQNVRVTAEYPDSEELSRIEYRSKLDLTEGVRIVTIEGCDACACCAPHVNHTGEIGIIKLLDSMRYKGGVRIRMLCGLDALDDYRSRIRSIAGISALLSVKQPEVLAGVERQNSELVEKKREIKLLRQRIALDKLSGLQATEGCLCVFEDGFDIDDLRLLVNNAPECRVCACFSPSSSGDGFVYVMGSGEVDLRAMAKEINGVIDGRGGGSSGMIQGNAKASREKIENALARLFARKE